MDDFGNIFKVFQMVKVTTNQIKQIENKLFRTTEVVYLFKLFQRILRVLLRISRQRAGNFENYVISINTRLKKAFTATSW